MNPLDHHALPRRGSWTVLLFVLGLIDNAMAGTVWLGGQITNPKNESISINDRFVPLSADGIFNLSWDMTDTGYVMIRHDDSIALYLSPGDSLAVTVDADDWPGSMRLHGRGADLNNFIVRIVQEMRTQDARVEMTIHSFFSQSEENFVRVIDSMRMVILESLAAYLADNPDVDSRFAKRLRAKTDFGWAQGRLIYPHLHAQLVGSDSESVSHEYEDYVYELKLDDPELLSIEEYNAFVGDYLYKRAMDMMKNDPAIRRLDNQKTHAKYDAALELFTEPSVQCHWLSSIMTSQITDYGIKGIDSLMTDFRTRCRADAYRDAVDSLYTSDSLEMTDHEIRAYKTFEHYTLDAHVFKPDDWTGSDRRAALLVLHGAGWYMGKPQWCFQLCRKYADLGMVSVAVQYRLRDRHGATVADCIADAKSAVRWMRANVDNLGIDPERIAAYGWSAGGHLAVCAAAVNNFDNPSDNLTLSALPDALLLLYPALDVSTDDWFRQTIAGSVDVASVSPLQLVQPGLPPTIIFQGVQDQVTPYEAAVEFTERMQAVGNWCELNTFEGRGHLFTRDPDDRVRVDSLSVEFLKSLGYIRTN